MLQGVVCRITTRIMWSLVVTGRVVSFRSPTIFEMAHYADDGFETRESRADEVSFKL
jgi:hypothetical protein